MTLTRYFLDLDDDVATAQLVVLPSRFNRSDIFGILPFHFLKTSLLPFDVVGLDSEAHQYD